MEESLAGEEDRRRSLIRTTWRAFARRGAVSTASGCCRRGYLPQRIPWSLYCLARVHECYRERHVMLRLV